jgi:hypothetical protein
MQAADTLICPVDTPWDSVKSLTKSTGLVESRLEQIRVPLDGVRLERKRPGLLRRFSATPYAANLLIMDKTICMESNRSQIIEEGREFLVRHEGQAAGTPECLWRIVGEADSRGAAIDICLAAFSDLGVRCINMGQRSFPAVELEARRFADNVLFHEDQRCDAHSTTVLDALSGVPAYELTYRDPEMPYDGPLSRQCAVNFIE